MKMPLKNSLILKDYLRTIEKISGLRVCLYDMNDLIKKHKNMAVDNSSITHTRPICTIIKRSDTALKKCLESDRKTPLNSLKRPLWRTCHAGLSELVIPVSLKGRYLGSIVAGQVLSKRLSKSKLEQKINYLSGLGVDKAEAKQALKETPVSTDDMQKTALDLLNILVNYIKEVEEKFDWQEELKNIKASYSMQNFKNGSEGLKFLTKKVKKVKDLRYNNIIKKVLADIRSRPLKTIRLQAISKEAGFSQFHFSRIFKKTQGISFKKHMAELRIEKAKTLMEDVKLNLSGIAYECGYEDLSSFSRAFKTFTGSNPGKFREIQINSKR